LSGPYQGAEPRGAVLWVHNAEYDAGGLDRIADRAMNGNREDLEIKEDLGWFFLSLQQGFFWMEEDVGSTTGAFCI